MRSPSIDVPASDAGGCPPASEAGEVAPPPGARSREAPNNVPAALSSLVGRAREVDALGRALVDARLLTLVGPGGAGKTRLAREVAAAAATAGTHPDGVWWVELAPVGAGSDVATTIATVLGVTLAPGRPPAEAIAAALGGAGAPAGASRPVLLVLDNCEHVVDDVARLTEALLRAAPALTILATSREALAIEGETAWPVPPLARPARGDGTTPDPATLADYAAVALFVERARAVVPGFALDAANARAVAAITARLDGLPLALELAAAALPALGIEPLAERLDDALGLLTRGRRTAQPRHRTLRAVLEWSDRLLAGDARALLRRLSVFRGAFTLDALEAVCTRPDDVADPVRDAVGALTRLVEHSLVEVREDGGETRYRLLETVRQFGAALLADTPDERATRVRHARWIARVAASAEPHLFSPARGRTVRRLQRDVDDIRAALAWTTRRVDGRPVGEPMTAVRIAGALGWFWFSGVPWEEARTLLAATLAAADAEGIADADRPLADRVALGTFFYPYVGQHYFASDTAGILALVPRELAVWDAVDAAGAADPAALSPAERLAAARGRALAYQLQALALAMHGDAGRAHSAMARSLATAEAAGDAWLVAVLTMRRALVHLVLGDPAAAAASYGAAIPLLHALGERWFLSLTYEGMAAGALLTGDLAAGVRDGRRSVQVLRAERDEWFASRSLDTLAALLAAADARRDDALALTAVRLLGAAEALRRRCGALPFGPDRERQARVVAALRARLDPDAYAAAHAAGASMTLDDVFAFVDDDAPFTAATVADAADASHHASRREATRGDATGHATRDGDTREVTRAATSPRTLRLDAFGPFALATDGVAWPAEALPLGKTRELLLWLLLHERGTKEEIAMDLWPDASSAQVRSSFHVTLHHLRRQLGDPAWIAHDRGGYRLARRPDPALILDADADAVLDVAARLRASGRAPDGAGDADARDTALAMARGALERRRGVLAEGMTVAWLAAHRARVQGAWADAMEALAARLAAAGRADEAHDVCERLVACEPLRESAHRQLMAALAARGETARALAHYRQVERLLDGALGARPSRETQRLAAQLAE